MTFKRTANKWWRYTYITCSALLALSIAEAGEDHTYSKDQAELCEAAKQILIKHGQCTSANDCTKKQIVFCSPGHEGSGLQLWGIRDYQIIEEVLQISASAFAKREGRMKLSVDIYPATKQESLARPFLAKEPKLVEVKFKGLG